MQIDHNRKRDLQPYRDYVKHHFNREFEIRDGGCTAMVQNGNVILVPTHYPDEIQMGVLSGLVGAALYTDENCVSECETTFEWLLYFLMENWRVQQIVRQHFPAVVPDINAASVFVKNEMKKLMSGKSPARLVVMIRAFVEGREMYTTDQVQEVFEAVRPVLEKFKQADTSREVVFIVKEVSRMALRFTEKKVYGFEFKEVYKKFRQNAQFN